MAEDAHVSSDDEILRELVRGCEMFRAKEPRDAMYKVSRQLVEEGWDRGPVEIADALCVLLLTWNQAFYRYGNLSGDRLEKALKNHWASLESYRSTTLLARDPSDDSRIAEVFAGLLDASSITTRRTRQVRRSPVAVGKALHLLAPRFFPLWDDKIAVAYRCGYHGNPPLAYLRFMEQTANWMRRLAQARDLDEVEAELNSLSRFPKVLLKYFDEYNYAKYTQGWL